MFGKYPRILFFVNGAVPTLEHQLAAERLAPCRVSFRNALLVGDEGSLEECDGVFGDVPQATRSIEWGRHETEHHPVPDRVAACPADQVLTIDAWDQS